MTVEEIKKAIVALDPYTIVKAGLDCFVPYAYFELTSDIQNHIERLSEDEQDEIASFIGDYLRSLQDGSTLIF